MRQVPICVFGEVLFDRFPDGHSVLGGAPFNVAWHLNAFGLKPYLRSSVGDDARSIQIRPAMLESSANGGPPPPTLSSTSPLSIDGDWSWSHRQI